MDHPPPALLALAWHCLHPPGGFIGRSVCSMIYIIQSGKV
jgi:hypothetical protein